MRAHLQITPHDRTEGLGRMLPLDVEVQIEQLAPLTWPQTTFYRPRVLRHGPRRLNARGVQLAERLRCPLSGRASAAGRCHSQKTRPLVSGWSTSTVSLSICYVSSCSV